MPVPWQELLDWWFGHGTTGRAVATQKQKLWFGYKPAQDDEARQRFGELSDQAADGRLQAWADSAQGWLALVLLLDQLPRMIHRGTPRAFAGDARAQQLVGDGLAQGWDASLAPIERVFIYLVLEHAEDLDSQELAVRKFAELRDSAETEDRQPFQGFLDFAERHRDVVARFARFPHRNLILGRASSEAERVFLSQPGSGF